MVMAYELSEFCKLEGIPECPHFDDIGFTVVFETGSGQSFKHEAKHLCAACVPAEARVFNAEWPRRIRRDPAKVETRVKSSSPRPSNRW